MACGSRRSGWRERARRRSVLGPVSGWGWAGGSSGATAPDRTGSAWGWCLPLVRSSSGPGSMPRLGAGSVRRAGSSSRRGWPPRLRHQRTTARCSDATVRTRHPSVVRPPTALGCAGTWCLPMVVQRRTRQGPMLWRPAPPVLMVGDSRGCEWAGDFRRRGGSAGSGQWWSCGSPVAEFQGGCYVVGFGAVRFGQVAQGPGDSQAAVRASGGHRAGVEDPVQQGGDLAG